MCFKACKAFFTHNTGSFDLNSEGEKTDWSKLFWGIWMLWKIETEKYLDPSFSHAFDLLSTKIRETYGDTLYDSSKSSTT